jgi:hypothetical protein
MSEIKTNALVPKGEENGLTALAPGLAEELLAYRKGGPRPKARAALCIFSPLRMTVEGDNDVVTVRIDRIEALLDEDLEEARKFIMRSLQARNGQAPLSLDFERDIEAAFGEGTFDNPPDLSDPDSKDRTAEEDPDGDERGGEDELGGEA